MATSGDVQSTPSLLGRPITSVREGQSLQYDELTGREKRDYLFDQGIRPTAYQGADLPDVVNGILLFSESSLASVAHHLLAATLTRESDELESPKPKLFHTYGTTAKVVFTAAPGTPYTGLLSETVPGLARFSYAGPVSGIGVVPGLGLKLFVDGGHPSESLVVMRKLDRQDSAIPFFHGAHNSVFQNPFTNILPDPEAANLVMRVVKARFETVVAAGKGLDQPLDGFGRVHANGEPVPAGEAAAPSRVIFRPTAEAKAASDPRLDFRDDLARNVKAGTPIYEVFALDEREETELNAQGVREVEDLLAHARKIGTIATESEFIASSYGDYRLFFKHNARFIRAGV
jgi:hypothetical protein